MKTLTRKIHMRNQLGLHLRPASEISRMALAYEAKITLLKSSDSADIHSIFDILILGVMCGDPLELSAVGHDAEDALNEIGGFLESYRDIEIQGKAPPKCDRDSRAA